MVEVLPHRFIQHSIHIQIIFHSNFPIQFLLDFVQLRNCGSSFSVSFFGCCHWAIIIEVCGDECVSDVVICISNEFAA